MNMASYPRNAWYPLTWSRDVGRELIHRRVLGEDIVVYRMENGDVAALEDACPHKLVPLSKGTLRGDAIECGYHGLTFNCEGRCTIAPGQPRTPAVRVRAFPVRQHLGLVWIWMGDPQRADDHPLVQIPQYDDPAYSLIEGDALPLAANYLSLADNLCDPTHVAFVHKTTLSNSSYQAVPTQHKQEGNTVTTWRWIIDAPIIPLFDGIRDFGGNVDRWHYYIYHAPCVAIVDFGTAKTGTGAPDGNREGAIQMFACHFITPVDEHNCIQHWLMLKNMPADPQLDQRLEEMERFVLDEDKVLLEAAEANERKRPGWTPLRIASDASSVKMRKIVSDMIATEKT
jgi:phenylpropionate dioxygenase-like ring-hydroxylating dioxygenase large terminal subunit